MPGRFTNIKSSMAGNVLHVDFRPKTKPGGKDRRAVRAGAPSAIAILVSDISKKSRGSDNSSHQSNAFGQGEWVFLFPANVAQDGGYLAQHRFADILNGISKYDANCHKVMTTQYDLHWRPGFLPGLKKGAKVVNAAQAPDAGMPTEDLPSANLDELLQTPATEDQRVYCIHYGPHVNYLLEKLSGRRVVYFAHSTGWEIDLPTSVTVVSVSKHCMGYWAKHAPASPQFYLPNVIDKKFCLPKDDSYKNRPIDVLVIKRKMSSYLIDELVPALQQSVNVKVVDAWDGDIELLMQQAKVFLYDSSEYWKTHGATEGFGLPPLEAMACGCSVFSSVNDGLSDFLEPGVNCQQLHNGSVVRDAAAIIKTVKGWQPPVGEQAVVTNYRRRAVRVRMHRIVEAIG